MKRLETASDLRSAWKAIAAKLALDLGALQRLTRDPLGTLKSLGYDVGPEAAMVLTASLP